MKLLLPASLALLLLAGIVAALFFLGRDRAADRASPQEPGAVAPGPARVEPAPPGNDPLPPARDPTTRPAAPAPAPRAGDAGEEGATPEPESLPLARGDAAVSFIITRASGGPAAATVTLLSGRAEGQAATDAHGIASFLDLAPGTYSFRIEIDDLPALAGAKSIPLADGERREIRIQIGDFHQSIAGRVLDRSGAPVAGIGVSARKHLFEAGEGELVRMDREEMEVVSDAEGAYEVTGLDEGDYMLSTRPTAKFPAARRVYRSGTTSADIVLATTRLLTIEGRVTAKDGGALAGAAVRPLGSAGGATTSRRDGRYQTEVEVPEGQTSHVLVATKEGFREARVHFRLDDQGDADRREVDIELEPLGPRAAVRGKLSGPDGEAVPGETVYLQSPSLDARYTAKTDGEGRFALADVQVGKDYRLWVYPQSGFKDHSRSDFEVPPEGIEVEIPLEAAAVGTLRGILADPDGRPVPRFTLWLRSLKALGRSLPLTSDAAGRFEVENVPEGDLIFETRSLPRFAVRGVQLAGGDEKDLTLVLDWGTHVAAGSVVDERGAPVAGAQVSLNWAQSAGGAQSSSFRNAVTDAAGRFSFSELAAGDHKLSVTSPDHGSVHVQYDVGAGAADPVIVVKEKRR